MKPALRQVVKRSIPCWILSTKLSFKGKHAILFTFDDGPHPEITPRVLDILDTHDAVGVFFIVGKLIKRAPHLLKVIQERGHIIGNHSYSHKTNKQLSFSEQLADMKLCSDSIYDLTGEYPFLYRPPRGEVSAKTLIISRLLRMKVVLWSIETGEYSFASSFKPEMIKEIAINNIKGQHIVLMHDDNDLIPDVLGSIIPHIKNRGFDLKNAHRFL